ncbi:MAG TPA: c-type cytochrome [Chitinophagaceae bacterium]|nr:c-type cytochrome [Chitinophagaceae bacterium]
MKKYLAVLALAGVFAACGGGSGSGSSGDSTASSSSSGGDITTNPDYQKGLALVQENDCLTCHAIADKKIGPPYVEVAKKYAGNDTAVNYLANKIIAGGSGVWGATPMTPHPALALDSAKQIVKYILLLDKQ